MSPTRLAKLLKFTGLPKLAGRFKAADQSRRTPTDQRAAIDQRTPTDQLEPADRRTPTDQRTAANELEPADRRTPTDQRTAANELEPADRRTPADEPIYADQPVSSDRRDLPQSAGFPVLDVQTGPAQHGSSSALAAYPGPADSTYLSNSPSFETHARPAESAQSGGSSPSGDRPQLGDRSIKLKRWPEWTLRTRMVVTVVGLSGLTLLITNIVGVTMLRSYLFERLDNEVRRLAQVVHSRPLNPGPAGPGSIGPRGPYDFGIPRGVGDPTNFVAYSPTGTVDTAFPNNIDPPDFGGFEELKPFADSGIQTMTDVRTGERYRVNVVSRPDGRGYAVAAISLTRVDNTINQMTAIGLGVSTLALLLLGFTGYQIVGLGLKPLTRMEEAASAIADGDLTRRVADTDPHTEAGRLGLALNTMLGRIEAEVDARIASEQRLRQFLADASHELRTPLTSIRGFAELYRRGGARSKVELDETMSLIEDEAARMGLLVEDLLLLAALDEERPLKRGKVDLLAVVADIVRDAHVCSPHRIIELGEFEPVTVSGDEHRLRQVTSNLVANALQHTPSHAQITLRVGLHSEGAKPVAAVGIPVRGPAAVLEVIDTGPGVPLEHAQRIFERLYRADPHRARSHGGAGLGLAIVTSIVKAHGGRIELATSTGHGSTFRVILPLA